MSTEAPPPAPERKPRCRYRGRLDDPCSGESIDSDPAATQLCVKHAMEGVKLLAAAGALTYKVRFTPATGGRA